MPAPTTVFFSFTFYNGKSYYYTSSWPGCYTANVVQGWQIIGNCLSWMNGKKDFIRKKTV